MSELPTHIRIVNHELLSEELQPGDMLPTTDEGIYIKACPKCGQTMATGMAHTITHHEDGTITVRASCLCPHEGCDAHYWITRNKIEWA